MVHGGKLWNDRDTYYVQTNNPTEEIKRKDGLETSIAVAKTLRQNGISESIIEVVKRQLTTGWLESCGPESAANCMAAAGHKLNIECPGSWKPQPGEILTDWFNDPANYLRLAKLNTKIDTSIIPGNRVAAFYPLAVKDVFNVDAELVYSPKWDALVDFFKAGKTVQLCLVDPGHYIAAVAFDDEKNEIIYRDPWPNNTWPKRLQGNDGFNRRMTRADAANLKDFAIVYEAPHAA